LIEKIDQRDHTLENLRSFSDPQLRQHYSKAEALLIEQKIKRQPIADDVVERILSTSNSVCAYCADGNFTRPYEIHHIEPYAVGQDNSEDNLILVCPTHHTWIHKTGEAVPAQKRKRREWQSLAELGGMYAAKGIPFPFGVLEPIDYGGEPSIIETLSSAPPSPTSCVELSKHPLGREALNRLSASNFLLLVGASGSGKSTLALGLSGTIPDAHVFRYRRPPDTDSRKALGEVLTFIATATKRCVLLLDDANGWATAGDLERIAAAASATIHVIATWTGGRLEGDPTAELHVLPNRVVVTWDDIRPALCARLLDREHEVIEQLQRIRKDDLEPLGYGPISQSLESLLRRYGDTARSVWQFLFLLRSGWTAVRDDLVVLIADGRADLPVLYAAIEQIASVERPVAIPETVAAIAPLSTSAGLPAGDAAWVARIFDSLVARRLVIRVRDAFTTVHRDWARALICSALEEQGTRAATTELLLRDFDCGTKWPRRLMILWSWLWYDPFGGRFASEWAKSQSPEAWRALVKTAATTSLVDVAMVARRLHMLFQSVRWTAIVGDALEANEAALTELVRKATAEDWYWLRELFMALDYARPTAAARVIAAWSPQSAARVLAETHPDHYESVGWFLSGAARHSLDWCIEVGRHLDWNTMASSIQRVRRGDVEALEECAHILSRLGVPLLRSRVRELATAMGGALRGAALADIRFEPVPGIMWLEFFPDDTRRVVDELDPKRLAAEFSIASPRHWSCLLTLSAFAERAGSDFARQLVDNLGEPLIGSVVRVGAANPYELRVLLWQLTYGSAGSRRELAAKLFEVAKAACEASDTESGNILDAFSHIDAEYAARLAADLGRAMPKTDGPRALNVPFLQRLSNADEVRRELERREQSGEDYDVDAVLFGSAPAPAPTSDPRETENE
jgi:energy-coupling factor transporter ATP-binding protein EcfA2